MKEGGMKDLKEFFFNGELSIYVFNISYLNIPNFSTVI